MKSNVFTSCTKTLIIEFIRTCAIVYVAIVLTSFLIFLYEMLIGFDFSESEFVFSALFLHIPLFTIFFNYLFLIPSFLFTWLWPVFYKKYTFRKYKLLNFRFGLIDIVMVFITIMATFKGMGLLGIALSQ